MRKKNIPQEIKLAPGQELLFYTFVVLNDNPDKNEVLATQENFVDKENEMRFCFVEVEKMSDLENIAAVSDGKVGKIYWSPPVAIRFPDNSYKIQPALAK